MEGSILGKVLDKGEVMVFPGGLLHFYVNVGEASAAIIGSFSSHNPGLVRIPSAVFGRNYLLRFLCVYY